MKAFLLSFVLIIASCNGTKKGSSMKNQEAPNNTTERLTLLLRDNYSGSDVEETLIIRNDKELRSFYSRVNRTRKPGLPLPDIDFTKEIVLVHCDGNQNTPMQSKLSILEKTDEELIVKISSAVIEQEKGTSIDISPFIVYKMPLIQKKISFKKNQ